MIGIQERIKAEGQVVIHGDCLEKLRLFPDDYFRSVVTDNPYGLGSKEPTVEEIIAYLRGADIDMGGDFMGKKWKIPSVAIWKEVRRVLKPGGLVLGFGGTRTFDLISLGLRAAGFENRDTISHEGVEIDPVLRWVYGQGFPHSLNAGREIDMESCTLPGRHYDKTLPKGGKAREGDHLCPPHPAGDSHRGEGTALKPAWEPILCFRKPLGDSVARTVLRHGTGVMNIDACRNGFVSKEDEEESKKKNQHAKFGSGPMTNQVYGEYAADRTDYDPDARWPANVILSDVAAEAMDAQVGRRAAGHNPRARKAGGLATNGHKGQDGLRESYLSKGGASRVFFRYCAKASRSEREAGCESLPVWSGAAAVGRKEGSAGTRSPRAGAGRTAKEVRNHHVTVKPIELMRWLLRLSTPPGGVALDLFCGSGTTLCAAALEDIECVGIEREAEYVEITKARVAYWRKKVDKEPVNDLQVGAMNFPEHLLEGYGGSDDDEALADEVEDPSAITSSDVAAALAASSPDPLPVPPPPLPDRQTVIPLPSTIGERIAAALCVVDSEYMVDAEDGHPPSRMILREVKSGKFKFYDGQGAKVELGPADFVWRLPLGAAPAAEAPKPESMHGAADGFGGDDFKPAAGPAVSVEAMDLVRSGNCPGSGKAVAVGKDAKKYACPACGEVRPIPKDRRGAESVPFVGHRPKEKAKAAPPAPQGSGIAPPDAPEIIPPEGIADKVFRGLGFASGPSPSVPALPSLPSVPAVPSLPSVPAAPPAGKPDRSLPVEPLDAEDEPPTCGAFGAIPVATGGFSEEAFDEFVRSSAPSAQDIVLSAAEASVLAALLGDKAKSLRRAVSAEALAVFRKLGLVE